jgi:murein DD-endopeptidase MepM/ murein hydrolase activator NlpD
LVTSPDQNEEKDMRDKRIKLIYFSLKGSEIKYIELSWKRMFLFASALLAFLFIVVASIIGLFTNYYHDFRIESLDRVNMTLRTQLQEMKEKVVRVQTKMEELEEKDDEERMIAGLDKIDKDMRSVGVGGSDFGYSEELAIFSDETREDIKNTQSLVDQLERRVQLLVESRVYIDKKFEENQDKLNHMPSIYPVQGGRITDLFGMRLDPFVEKVRKHNGLDIAARTGTPVNAVAAGTVERVKHNYRPNKGYGKEVVINHGYGIKTRYAHLHKIYVRVGQKINRWDVIASVGTTGRATGPHLHYEVIVSNKRVNPIKYILE